MSSPEVVQMCCLIDEGERCQSRATGATFNRKLFKTALQRRQRLYADLEVEIIIRIPDHIIVQISLYLKVCFKKNPPFLGFWPTITLLFQIICFPQAGHNYVCEHHRILLHGMRAKRKRKDSEEEGDYQPEVSCC